MNTVNIPSKFGNTYQSLSNFNYLYSHPSYQQYQTHEIIPNLQNGLNTENFANFQKQNIPYNYINKIDIIGNQTQPSKSFTFSNENNMERIKVLLARKNEECEFWKRKFEDSNGTDKNENHSNKMETLENHLKVLIEENAKLNDVIRFQMPQFHQNKAMNHEGLVQSLKSSFAYIEEHNMQMKLKELMDKLDDYQKEISDGREKIQRLEQRNNSLEKSKDEALQSQKLYFEQEFTKLSSLLISKENELDNLRNEFDNLEMKILDYKDVNSNLVLLSAENERLHFLMKKLQRNIDNTNQKQDEFQNDSQLTSLKEKAKLEEELWKAKNKIKQLETENYNEYKPIPTSHLNDHYNSNESFKEEIKKLKSDKQTLIKEMDFISNRNKVCEEEISKLNSKVIQLESEKGNLKGGENFNLLQQENSRNLEIQKDILEKRLREKDETIGSLKVNLKILEDQLSNFQKDKTESNIHRKEVEELTLKIQNLKQEKSHLEDKLNELKRKFDELENSNISFQKKNQSLESENSELKELATAFGGNKYNYEGEISNLVRIKNELESQIKEDYLMIKEQEEDIRIMSSEIFDQREKIGSLTIANDIKSTQIVKLQNDLNSLSEMFEEKEREGVPLENVFSLLGLIVIQSTELENSRIQLEELNKKINSFISPNRETRSRTVQKPHFDRSPDFKAFQALENKSVSKRAIQEIKNISRSRNQSIEH